MQLDRRKFLTGAAAAAGAVAVGANRADAFVNLALPSQRGPRVAPRTPIDHIVVVMMENRSTDHYLGWRAAEDPNFRGTQRRRYAKPDGTVVKTENWGTAGRKEYAGCGFGDPGHGWGAGHAQVQDSNGDGEPDGFLATGSGNDEYALSYYNADDIPVTAELVRRFTTCDRYFCSVLTSTYPNREYMHSAQTGGLTKNDFPPQTGNPDWALGFDWPTIWTLLEAKGVTWTYYYSNLPVIALWGSRHAKNARHISNYYADAAAGLLPQVAFVDPFFVAPEGLANDDHPHADIRLGQEFLSGVVTSFIESSAWQNGALFINYDEWGGFWDHIAPPVVADPRAADGFGQLGFRVPAIVVSPYAPVGRAAHSLFDHTSILRFIETNWNLGRLKDLDPMARDAGPRSIERAFARFATFEPEVDLAKLTYTAPLDARQTCELPTGELAVSELFQLEEMGWFERFGFRTDWRFEDSFR